MPTPPLFKAPPHGLAWAHAYDPANWARFVGMATLVTVIATASSTQTWASAQMASAHARKSPGPVAAAAILAAAPSAPAQPTPGVDVDGDGRGDFANPTGQAERTHDDYGCGAFGSSRDGGERRHEGVDYVSRPGQVVVAPMSGYVARIGYAYADDPVLRTIEIVNPALHYVAKVLYVSPTVSVGQAVAVGAPLGRAQSLQAKYPGGMTNHVHVQIARQGGPWLNAERLIPVTRG